MTWEQTPYSVPFAYVLDLVVVRATEHEVIVYGKDLTEMARHERAPRGHRMPVVNPVHRPEKKSRCDIDALVAKLAELGDAATLFAAGVCKQQRYRGSHLAQTLALVERYDADDITRALERAVCYRAFDAQVVERILQASARPRSLPDTCEEQARRRLDEVQKTLDVHPRSLDAYAAALEGGNESRKSSGPFDPRDPQG